jgi:predicted GNAT family N-acyltransferase
MEKNRINSNEVDIIPLTVGIDYSSFCCSENKLNEFLIEDALEDHNNLYSITRLVKYNNEIVGFFSLITDNISIDQVDKSASTGYAYNKLPAVKIARLATSKQYEKRDVGKIMITEIFRIVYQVTQNVGCRVITVDAKTGALGFYRKFAFKEVMSKKSEETIPMYLDFKTLLGRNIQHS